jgi:hypothetical protein
LRNRCLYPVVRPSGIVDCPKNLLTAGQGTRLLGRVKSLVVKVAKDI